MARAESAPQYPLASVLGHGARSALGNSLPSRERAIPCAESGTAEFFVPAAALRSDKELLARWWKSPFHTPSVDLRRSYLRAVSNSEWKAVP